MANNEEERDIDPFIDEDDEQSSDKETPANKKLEEQVSRPPSEKRTEGAYNVGVPLDDVSDEDGDDDFFAEAQKIIDGEVADNLEKVNEQQIKDLEKREEEANNKQASPTPPPTKQGSGGKQQPVSSTSTSKEDNVLDGYMVEGETSREVTEDTDNHASEEEVEEEATSDNSHVGDSHDPPIPVSDDIFTASEDDDVLKSKKGKSKKRSEKPSDENNNDNKGDASPKDDVDEANTASHRDSRSAKSSQGVLPTPFDSKPSNGDRTASADSKKTSRRQSGEKKSSTTPIAGAGVAGASTLPSSPFSKTPSEVPISGAPEGQTGSIPITASNVSKLNLPPDTEKGEETTSSSYNSGEVGASIEEERITPFTPLRERTPRNPAPILPPPSGVNDGDDGDDGDDGTPPPPPPGGEQSAHASGGGGGKWLIGLLLAIALIASVVLIPLMFLGGRPEIISALDEKCEVADADSINQSIAGSRGVPQGDHSKPMVMGKPLTKEMGGGEYAVIASPYGPRGKGFHSGLDISTNADSYYKNGFPHSHKKLYAVDDGIVAVVNTTNNPGGYGTLLVLEHTDENGDPYTTLYGHVFPDEVMVKPGDRVFAGQPVAYQGTYGKSSGLHVHFEIRKPPSGKSIGVDKVDTPGASSLMAFYDSQTVNPDSFVKDATNPDPNGVAGSSGIKKDDDDKGVISKTSTEKDEDESEENETKSSGDDNSDDEPKSLPKAKGDVVSIARSFVGKVKYTDARPPSPEDGMDCSGLISYSYKQVGITTGGNTLFQFKDGDSSSTELVYDLKRDGEKYDEKKFNPGDIIIYGTTYGAPSHVSMYIGDGRVVHSSTHHKDDYTKDIVETTITGASSLTVQRVIRYLDSVDSSPSGGTFETNCCGEEGTMQENFIKSGGASHASSPIDSLGTNAEKIIATGKVLGESDDSIKFALAVAMARTDLSNVSNDASNAVGGNEQLPAEEIRKSLELGEGEAATDSNGAMGVFRIAPGAEYGGVEQMMNVVYQTNLFFEHAPFVPGEANYNDLAHSMPFGFSGEAYEGRKEKAGKIFDKYSENVSKVIEEESKDQGSETESDASGGSGEDKSFWSSAWEKTKDVVKDVVKYLSENTVGDMIVDGIDKLKDIGSIDAKVEDGKAPICETDYTGGSKQYSGDLNTAEIPEQYVDMIIESAKNTKHITPPMIASILHIETGFKNIASYNGAAHGIAQFTPETWAAYGNGGDIYNPRDSIMASGRYLDYLYEYAEGLKKKRGGEGDDTLLLMAASYNGGPGVISGGAYACPGSQPAELPVCGKGMAFDTRFGQAYDYSIKFAKAMEKFSK